MKYQIKGIIVLFFIILNSVHNVESQATSNPVTIVADDGFEYSAFAKSKLIWPEGAPQNLELNVTLKLIPENISRIYIYVVSYIFVEIFNGIARQIEFDSDTPEIILSNSNKTRILNKTLYPPNRVDNFYLNITMSAGTSFNTLARDRAIRFPDTGTIFIDRDKLVPLVNLYGFPPSSFFAKFLPMYGLILAIMVVPGVYYSVNNLMERRHRPTNKPNDGEDETND